MKGLSFILALVLLMGAVAGCGKQKTKDTTDSQHNLSYLPRLSFFEPCSADEALALAKDAGFPVIENLSCTAGQDAWENFYRTVTAGTPAAICCLSYYTLDPDHMSIELYEAEKRNYPQAFFTLLIYDGKDYFVATRMSTDTKPEHCNTFPYLLHLTENRPVWAASIHYDIHESYVLTDDPTITMERIRQAMFSSDSAIAFAFQYYTIFENFFYRDVR